MTRITEILFAARATLVPDMLGVAAIAAMTVGLLHIPSLV